MNLPTRKSLTTNLSKLSVEIAAALRVPMRTPGPVQDAARALHREEQVGDAFDLWTDLLSRRAAVLWILRSLYVRILEDRGLLQPRRILDAEDDLFRHLAPNLGPTSYLRWVYRDLASLDGGLPELFAPQPAEVAPVPDALSQKLIDFWRARNPDTGALAYRFDDEHFDSRLMGDLYQDLDPVVKKRYALLQTPDFVLDFILDETLTPAIAEWGVETVRVLDPACGSGHFLLAAFKRIVTEMRAKFPDRPARDIVQDVLARVVGIDLNDYACALARARLVMTALEMCGETALASAAPFHPRVFWADALEQVEADEQLGLTEIAPDHRTSTGLLTPPEVRAVLRPELKTPFHAVVGNPPFDQEHDKRRREYHRSENNGARRYRSSRGLYTLAVVFIERFLQLAARGGYVGLLTSSAFAMRGFGRFLVHDVIRHREVLGFLDISGVNVPGAGIAACVMMLRNNPSPGAPVKTASCSRAAPKCDDDDEVPPLWREVRNTWYAQRALTSAVTIRMIPSATYGVHRWSFMAADSSLAERMSTVEGSRPVSDVTVGGGFVCITKQDPSFLMPAWSTRATAGEARWVRPLIEGGNVRNWSAVSSTVATFPYLPDLTEPTGDDLHALSTLLWPLRTVLGGRKEFDGRSYRDSGRYPLGYGQIPRDRFLRPHRIVFAEMATHNHFCLIDDRCLCDRSAPVLDLPANASATELHALVGILNSSSVALLLRSDAHRYGEGGGTRVEAGNAAQGDEAWKDSYAFTSGVVRDLRIPRGFEAAALYARHIMELVGERERCSPMRVLGGSATHTAASLGEALRLARTWSTDALLRVVALQEELDWLCYDLYGLDARSDVRPPEQLGSLSPGLRPFEVVLARQSAESREAMGRGDEVDEAPTEWFVRHGWDAHATLDALPEAERVVVQARIDRTRASQELFLLEQATYKRRWYKPDYDREEREAMGLWIDNRLEVWGKERSEPFSAPQAGAAFRSDAAVLAVGELLTGKSDFDVDALIEERLRLAAVPNLKHHIFKPEGLLKRAEWEKTWEEQHKEDRGEAASPAVPPKYDDKDYLKKEYWSLRGKLDVPKERFVAFTEVPPPVGAETLYAWAGWTPRERAKAMLGLDEKLESAGVSVADRHGLLYGVWFLLPYVAWESPEAARDFRADVKSVVGDNGVTEAMLDEWAKRFPPPKGGKPAKPKPVASIGEATEKPKKAKRAKAKGESA